MPKDPYVLVVDDDPRSRQLMVDLMELVGIPVKTAGTGVEALRHIRKKAPGFVIVDLLMPGMHGLTLLSRLKLDLEHHRIPTLVITGAPLSSAEIAKLSSSVLGVVRKGDISMQDIAYVIEETLKDAPSF
jgi:CheY-like chemotaxis protein